MVERGVLATKTASIRDAVARVRDVLPASADEFARDRDAREIVALNLLVAIQDAVDLAAHWIADEGASVPGTQRELFEALALRGAIDAGLAHRLAGACGMRNVIAHQYGSVDWIRVHEAASGNLGDLEAFCAELASRA